MALAILAAEGQSGSMPFLIVGVWVLLLAIFLGIELIQKVPPTLHTPLMSGSNAISGITVVGSMLSLGSGYPIAGLIMGFVAVVLAMINVVGGFVVTNRMLSMFGGKRQEKP